MDNESIKKKKWEFPNVFALLFMLIIFTTIVSYFIPAGSFEREEKEINGINRTLVVEGTYQPVEAESINFFNMFEAVYKGMENAAPIIFFIFIIGGAFGILNQTQAIERGLNALVKNMENRQHLLIPILMLLFAIGGATFGMAEERIPFMLILIPLVIRIGYSSMIAAAVVILGSVSGFTAAFFNPFTVGIAQGIAQIPLFSGLGFRLVMWVIMVGITIAWVMMKAKKVKKDREAGLIPEEELDLEDFEADTNFNSEKFTINQKIILTMFIATICTIAVGVSFYGWYIMEIATMFLMSGILMGLVGRLTVNEIADGFISGCKELVQGALVVGFAYGVLVILEESMTIDTILNVLANSINHLPSVVSALAMLITQSGLNFLVPSGSGQAALSMPIMSTLADLTDVSRQTAVLAFQLGDGISNAITPTSGVLMASLAIAKVEWTKWAKFVFPIIIIHYVLAVIFVTIAHLFVF